jgi:hypothetical protein
MEKLLQLILERLEQIQQYLFSRRGGGNTPPVQVTIPERVRVQEPLRVISDSGSYVSGDVEITNTPLPVSIDEQPVQVSQSGAWSVGISPQPVQVSQSGTWNVGISNTPVPVSQSGTWSVGVSGQPISVTVTNTPLIVAHSTVLYVPISATNSGPTQVVGAVSGKRIRVIAFAVVASATVTIKFQSGTTDITGSMRLVEGGGIAHAYDGGLFQTGVNQPLNINLSTNATVGGYVVYREV